MARQPRLDWAELPVLAAADVTGAGLRFSSDLGCRFACLGSPGGLLG